MDKLTIRTNNVPRNTLYGYELSKKDRSDFDYLSDEQFCDATFFRFKGNLYDVSEFMIVCDEYLLSEGWQAYASDSYFSGVVIKFPDNDMETVIVGQYFS